MATLIAVYGAGLVTPLGWKYAGIVWGYAFAWFLVTDPLKLLTYKVLDTYKTDTKPRAIAEPTAASIAGSEPADKAGSKLKSEADAAPDANARPKAKEMNPSENHDATKPKSSTAPAPEPKPDANAAPGAEPAPKAAA